MQLLRQAVFLPLPILIGKGISRLEKVRRRRKHRGVDRLRSTYGVMEASPALGAYVGSVSVQPLLEDAEAI